MSVDAAGLAWRLGGKTTRACAVHATELCCHGEASLGCAADSGRGSAPPVCLAGGKNDRSREQCVRHVGTALEGWRADWAAKSRRRTKVRSKVQERPGRAKSRAIASLT